MISIPQLVDESKLFLKGNPLIYPLYLLTTQWSKKHVTISSRLCMPWHDLVLEGYQRSANSFAFNLVNRFYPEIRVVHHSHSIATLRIACAFKLPIIVLIRDPIEAVGSSVVRSGKSPRYLVSSYIWFYTYVSRIKGKLTLVSFETVTGNPSVLLRVVSELTGAKEKEIEKHELQLAIEEAFQSLPDLEESKGRSDYYRAVAVPNAKKEAEKKKVKDLVRSDKRISEALDLYNDLLMFAV